MMGLQDLQPAAGQVQELTGTQRAQMEHDVENLLAAKKGSTAREKPPVNNAGAAAKHTSGVLHLRRFPMGGWVYHDVSYRWQRVDQGQDFEIPTGHHIIAPGWGHCVSHLSDREWPSGFGSPYAVVYIGSGRFAGRLWYLGHDNYVQIRAGESFHTGRILARPTHEMNADWVWSEIGHAPNGFPGPFGEGARFHSLFQPLLRWTK